MTDDRGVGQAVGGFGGDRPEGRQGESRDAPVQFPVFFATRLHTARADAGQLAGHGYSLVRLRVAGAVMGVDDQPDILSFEPRPRRGARRLGPRRGILIFVLGVLLASLGVGAYLALLTAHQDDTIHHLQAALRQARQSASGSATGAADAAGPARAAGPALPADSGSALSTFPDAAGGSFSMVAAAVRPRPGAAALTWLFVYGQHARPGERYGLLEGTCGGQYVTASDLADATADRKGDLAIVAPNLAISSSASDVWVLVYRLGDGVTLGGIQGPLIGGGARPFRIAPPC